MFSGLFFICWRAGQLVTLIPPLGMLSWFIDGFVKANMLTPTYILVLFIVTVLASVWAVETLVRYSSTKRSAIFVSFVDICFFGSFVASVYLLRGIAVENCNSFTRSQFLQSLGPFGFWGQRTNNPLSQDPTKVCSMLKASFAFAILNTMSFFFTAIFAYFLWQHETKHQGEKRSRRHSHSSRRSQHRHRSSSGRRGDYHV
ncbi:hypothetical protein D8B26_004555 [Coccidioides posadasii str. Silveira]|uniref:Uncharacterized protein n=3 Tax=Coccidioides posadasii TaxID=199306 RepID=E9DEN4_COCPS|nr:hypothetical protein CPC735_061090 [Coccidioides posadasii C735 delta SOWgp]EER28236.1 hypothetical protein CPC735_061090 [Coccidioides posadasii C735 delta SOWgp]EFW15096.1 conserved hypothetical protein [Coccidioides posadasii str. Silveira]KMM68869.1 hypothetical protein CPAG_05193 [Coccidioides posadasii RMSCC 3488]QVM09895.1 hypothetical protein D8B26_004555 [Coccidioides posadasii str. Silveira]|eukprot:XP_003070381.1 hypothetical protein CPC735_061090 [Coccidioides posadasii C735 delta SOWgp]